MVREWLAEQDHPSLSLRILIKEDIQRHGLMDATCRMMYGGPSGGTKAGRPRQQTARDPQPARQADDVLETANDVSETKETRRAPVPKAAARTSVPKEDRVPVPEAVPAEKPVAEPPEKSVETKPSEKSASRPVKDSGQASEGDGAGIRVERPQDTGSVRSMGTGSGESMENLLAMTENAQAFSAMMDLDDEDGDGDGEENEEDADGQEG